METLELVVLPIEVQELANKVSTEKREEVNNVLNQIFAGTSEWKAQVDAIEVKGVDDKLSIKLADEARKTVKTARLDAEKVFDAKREEVQYQMQSFQTEDKLWLKAKQTMQILFKDIEDRAQWKSDYVKRYEAEKKELRTLQRANRLQPLNPDIQRVEYENMSDETFTAFVAGIEKTITDRIEAARISEEQRLEAIRIENERIEAQRIENERLKAEAAEREAQHQKEREAAQESQRLAKIEADKVLEEQRKAAKAEADKQAAILAQQKAENDRIAAELKAKQDQEAKAKKEREAAVLTAKKEADKLAKAPIKKQLQAWVNGITIGQIPEHDKAFLIQQKFEGFKVWALNEIESL